jgi:hypothetical protein
MSDQPAKTASLRERLVAPFERLSRAYEQADVVTKAALWVGVVVAVFALGLMLSLGVALLTGDSDNVANLVAIVRDLFIILLAMQGMIIGIAIVIVLLQIAATVNVIQTEVDPILRSLQETAATVKGTSEFLSENLTTPVIESKAWIVGAATLLREVMRRRQSPPPSPEGTTHDAPSS